MNKHHVLIVEARFYADIADHLATGAIEVLKDRNISFERLEVPGALEIPPAIKIAEQRQSGAVFDAYIALGCVLRGETSHYDIVAGESARGLVDLSLRYGLAIGNGILTCDTKEQAFERAHPEKRNKGADAASAALRLLEIKKDYGVT